MATRDSLLEQINKVHAKIQDSQGKLKTDLGGMVQDSHDVQNKQIENLKKDTEV